MDFAIDPALSQPAALNDTRIFDSAPTPAGQVSPDASSEPASGQPEAESNPGYVVYNLYRPAVVGGKEIRKIILDFDGLPGDTTQNVEAEMRSDGVIVPLNPVMSATYCQYIAARAAKMNIADIKKLSFKDQAVIVMRVQNFITN